MPTIDDDYDLDTDDIDDTDHTVDADTGHDSDGPIKRKIGRLLLRSALCQARQLRRGLSRPRKRRLVKEARAVKSLMADARAAGLVPPARMGAPSDGAVPLTYPE